MARRKLSERYVRSLTKTSGGRSYAVIIPLEYIRKLKWRSKQKVLVRIYGKKIIIEDLE